MATEILEGDGLRVRIEPLEARPHAIADNPQSLLQQRELRQELDGTKHRLLSFQTEDDDGDQPVRFKAAVYDYTNQRTLLAAGDPDDLGSVTFTDSTIQPLPTQEEFEEAIAVLKQDSALGEPIQSGALTPYRPMPPLANATLADGTIERILNVGLYSERSDLRHRFVGVDLARGAVDHHPEAAARASDDDCGVRPVDRCSRPGRSGKVRVTVTKEGEELWGFDVVRPLQSSGTNGSGVELMKVNYQGRRVLQRAHVPILNVEYSGGGRRHGCGPTYRDWQDEEACFEADGDDVVLGYRACPTPARTLLDGDTDRGNFRGVAFFIRNEQLFVVSEMAAGWYRYISEWRLHADGIIRPRFGFAATSNPCTCRTHHHHAYWRLAFTIGNAPSVVQEFNDPPVSGVGSWHDIRRETRRLRHASSDRKWRVRDPHGHGYEIIPGRGDGSADDYGVGDVWILRRRSGQIDDGEGFSTDPSRSKAQIDRFVNGESVVGQDVVVW